MNINSKNINNSTSEILCELSSSQPNTVNNTSEINTSEINTSEINISEINTSEINNQDEIDVCPSF